MATYENSSIMDAAARDENGELALHSSGARTAAHRQNAAAAYLYYPGAREVDAAKNGGAAYQYRYPGAPTTHGRDERGAAGLYPDARVAAPTKNGAPTAAAAQTKDNVARIYPSVHADAASQVTNGAPAIFSDVRAAAQNEDVTVYTDGDMPGAAAERGDVDVHFFELPRLLGYAAGSGEMLPYQTHTMASVVEPAAAYYNRSGVVAGGALPLASQVFGAKTTSAPAVAVGHDEVAGAFSEPLRHELPDFGLSLASLAVAGLAAGDPTPAVAFGLFLMLIVSLSTVTIRALRD